MNAQTIFRNYCQHRDHDCPRQHHDDILLYLQNNDCGNLISSAVDGNDVAKSFVRAATRNHIDVFQSMLGLGIDVNIKDDDGTTALMKATTNGHKEIILFLLNRGAKTDIQSKLGSSALLCAALHGDDEIVEWLLEKNANVNIQDQVSGTTPLMAACRRGFVIIVHLLLSHNADIDVVNHDGKTALDLCKNEDINELLKNHVCTSFLLK